MLDIFLDMSQIQEKITQLLFLVFTVFLKTQLVLGIYNFF